MHGRPGHERQNFTWSNNRRGDDRVCEILDCILINSRWGANFLNVICINELEIGSYHSPLTLLMNGEPNRRTKNFSFEEM